MRTRLVSVVRQWCMIYRLHGEVCLFVCLFVCFLADLFFPTNSSPPLFNPLPLMFTHLLGGLLLRSRLSYPRSRSRSRPYPPPPLRPPRSRPLSSLSLSLSLSLSRLSRPRRPREEDEEERRRRLAWRRERLRRLASEEVLLARLRFLRGSPPATELAREDGVNERDSDVDRRRPRLSCGGAASPFLSPSCCAAAALSCSSAITPLFSFSMRSFSFKICSSNSSCAERPCDAGGASLGRGGWVAGAVGAGVVSVGGAGVGAGAGVGVISAGSLVSVFAGGGTMLKSPPPGAEISSARLGRRVVLSSSESLSLLKTLLSGWACGVGVDCGGVWWHRRRGKEKEREHFDD